MPGRRNAVGLAVSGLVVLCLVAVACKDRGAARDSELIRAKVAEMAEEAEFDQTAPVPGDDPCAGVTQEQMDRVQEQMTKLNQGLVMFGAEEMRALRCLRSKR